MPPKLLWCLIVLMIFLIRLERLCTVYQARALPNVRGTDFVVLNEGISL
ncbi:MAG TPA: hypothetical protein VN426_10720 [Syntrophomonadaceae bacterium]|nr:hypothetical protein [Syntrophomonadaceae bacterium]